jgi:AraC family transcriptional activator of pobA
MEEKENFPVLGITEFRDELHSDSNFQYHELHGKKQIEKPHKHDFFVFLLFERGNGVHTIDFTDHQVAEHQLHLLFPDQVHHWVLGEQTRAYQIMVSRAVFETFANALRFSFVLYQHHPVMSLKPETFKWLFYEFKAIEYELSLAPTMWEIIRSRIEIIAQMVSREAEHVVEDVKVYHAKPILFKYLSLIDVYFKEQKLVAFYAEKLNITPNYLNILCKKHFQTSATSVIQNRVILEAKRLLLTSKHSIKEIAYHLGFLDLAYFSKFFKLQSGKTPREFREQL